MKVIWSNNFSIGDDLIDSQHKKLISMLNEANDILDAVKDEKDAYKSVDHLIQEMIDYSIYHFDAEERLMERLNYPALEEHRAEHKHFKDKVMAIRQEDFSVDTYDKTNELLKFLFKWLINHINYSDKKITKYM